jgi:PAS domain S-box-containing protein
MPPSHDPMIEDPGAAETASASDEHRPSKRPFGNRTRTIYYLLVLFNLATILRSVWLNNQLGAGEHLAENERLAAQLSRLSDVEIAAGAVRSPGSEIFSNGEVAAERARLQVAAAGLRQAMHAVRAGRGGEGRSPAEWRQIDGLTSQMIHGVDETIRHFSLGRIEDATRSMAKMDRAYAALRVELAAARTSLRDRQVAKFRRESLRNRQLGRQHAVSVLLMAGLILGLVAYGRRLDREVGASHERERYVDTLHGGKMALRLALGERDARTGELIQNQEILSQAQRIARMGSWEWDVASGKVRWSDELFRLVGREPAAAEPTYEAYMDVIATADRERVTRRLAQALDDLAPFEHEYGILLPNGESRVHRTAVRVDAGEGKTVLRMFGVVQDVTEWRRAEERMLRQEAQLAEAQRIARLGSWELDVQTGQVIWSEELYAILGTEPGQVAPSFKHYLELLPEEDRSRVAAIMREAMADQERFQFEHSLVRAGGEERCLFVQGVITRDEQGQPTRVIGVSQDITERRKAENDLRLSEDRFNLASQATNDVIWDIDLISGQVWVNESFASQFGYPQWGDIHSDVWLAAIHPEDVNRVHAGYLDVIESDSTTWNIQYRLAAFGGEWHDVLYRGHIVRGHAGKALRLIGAMMDISERRGIERMKDEFIATVSHELRTPLTSIRGALGLLSSGRLGTLPEKGQRLLDIASSNTDRLVRLINDILDIERIESGEVTLTKSECDAGVLARTAADVVRTLADRENIQILVDAPQVPLVADSDRMIQLLTNLLGNAVKFSPSGSAIRLAVRSDGSSVVFSVADEGRGIPADKLESIFERFQQVDASDSRDKGGSGLGLTICRSIVRQHGGEIGVESQPGNGSTFTVTMPAGKPDDALPEIDRRIIGLLSALKSGTDEEPGLEGGTADVA